MKQPTPFFPLHDVTLTRVEAVSAVKEPVVTADWVNISAAEFWMSIDEIGEFYARNGNYIEYSPHPEATLQAIELFLNGSVYGAILHQRGLLPIHGSSFVYKEKGIMLCGESGAGKSSLTTAMCISGAHFLTDDVTPIQIFDGKPHILAKSDRVKLWDDSLAQLSQNSEHLHRIRPENDKYYFNIDHLKKQETFPLHQIVILKKTDVPEPVVQHISGAESFSLLQQEIYREFYLRAMPEKQALYFQAISTICNTCTVTKILRPEHIPIKKMKAFLVGQVFNQG